MSDIAISVEGLSKSYFLGHNTSERERYTALRDVVTHQIRELARKTGDMFSGRQIVQGDVVEEFWALDDVSFEVKQGEVLGIIGRNGAGKSTLLKILSRITDPTKGRVAIAGRVSSLLEVGTGFHPELTGRENVFLNGAILGMSRQEIKKKFDEIVSFAEVENFIDTPVKRYSSGMYVRLAFSVAAFLEPDILIVDEVLAVGDGQFQKKCLEKVNEITGVGRTVLMVSHNMAAIQSLSSRALYLMNGRVKAVGSVSDVIADYAKLYEESSGDFSKANRAYYTGECEIEDAWIETDENGRASAVEWDQPFCIQLIVKLDKPVRCSPEFIIRDSYGIPILFAPTGLYDGFECNYEPGLYQISSRCSGLRLASGVYSIDVALAHSGIRFLIYYESAIRLEAPDKSYLKNNWIFRQTRNQGTVPLSLKLDWRRL